MSSDQIESFATDAVLAEIVRGDLVESQHRGHLLALKSDGSVEIELGDIHAQVYPRSAVKSMQAVAMMRNGLNLNHQQLALVCASHSASEKHMEVARSILASVGLDEGALRNTPDFPIGEVERKAWGEKPASSIAQNCSGKHAGMVATCAINGWDLETYREPDHPLQREIKKVFEDFSGETTSHTTVDGCGAALFSISTAGMAQAIHRITREENEIFRHIHQACMEHPDMVAGEGRLSTRLMRQVPGLFMKEGAEAVNVLSLSDGRTLAFKISDGSQRTFSTIIARVLSMWGIEIEDAPLVVLGGGKPVGQYRAAF